MASPPLTPAAEAIESPSGHTERDKHHTDGPSLRFGDHGQRPWKGIPLAAGAGRPKGLGHNGSGQLVFRDFKAAVIDSRLPGKNPHHEACGTAGGLWFPGVLRAATKLRLFR